MSVFVCGDTHHDYDIEKLSIERWPEQEQLTLDDFLIQLGDFGVPWSNDRENPSDLRMFQWWASRPWTTLVIPGNHENYDRLALYPEIEMFGGPVQRMANNVYILQRGYVYEVDGKKIFAMSGGFSIDKDWRTEFVSWWSQEMPTYQEILDARKRLEEAGCDVDYVLTHTCSNITFEKLFLQIDLMPEKNKRNPLRHFLDWVEENVKFKEWHFGHFHDDVQVDEKHFLHYNKPPVRLI